MSGVFGGVSMVLFAITYLQWEVSITPISQNLQDEHLHLVVKIEQAVGCANDNARGSDPGEDDSVDLLSTENLLKTIASSCVVTGLLQHHISLQNLKQER